MKIMLPVDFSRIRAFCAGRGGIKAVASALGQGRDYFIARSHAGTISSIVLQRMSDMYKIPPRLFYPSTPAEEFLGWMEANPPKPKQKQKVCDSTCRGCRFFGPLAQIGSYSSYVCQYILFTNHARGCPPGEGCKRREEGTPLYVSAGLL